MENVEEARSRMVERQIRGRGIRDERLLAAMSRVERERFLPAKLHAQAYDDIPLFVAEDLVLPQPHVTAFMLDALDVGDGDRVLQIGIGAGYAAALLRDLGAVVHAVERSGPVAERARGVLGDGVLLRHDDDPRAWEEAAPFDAILVDGAMAEIPWGLTTQLTEGGRLVVAVGRNRLAQELVRVTRTGRDAFEREDLADIRFVPLLDDAGRERGPLSARVIERRPRDGAALPELILRHAEVFETPETADLSGLVERIGNRRVVLIGEASHGTSDFYRMRAHITRRLIEEKGFSIVALEADWPDAAHIDTYVRHREVPAGEWEAFARFPAWMWRNEETRDFADWLRARNRDRTSREQAGIYGLDLYSLFASTRAILDYLDDVDADLARLARDRYGCLSPFEADPVGYARATRAGAYRDCEEEVTRMLADLMRKRAYMVGEGDGYRFLDAAQNAALVANAERYYRTMYYGSRMSWNLRDGHMFETLLNVLDFHGPDAKAVVWAHNSHIGDARATEMAQRGERNLGEMCARGFGTESYRIGMGTHEGTVAAASDWGGAMEVMEVRPSHAQSYEWQFHQTQAPGLILPMRAGREYDLATALAEPRLERAIGVIYRPENELASHYFEAELPRQFDEYVWIDRTRALRPLRPREARGLPSTYPFGV
jgi:protein-L-isoaspartate(D-aspartate) O-methyltransferase